MTKYICLICIIFLSLALKAQHKELDKLYSKGKYQTVLELGSQKLVKSPDDEMLNMLVGRARLALGFYKTAIPLLEKAIRASASHISIQAWSMIDLGTAYYHMGEIDKAFAILQKVKTLKASRKCIRFAERQLMLFQMSPFFQSWSVKETKNLRFHFQDVSGIENMQKFLDDQQEVYACINRFFKADVSKKIDVFVWTDKEKAFDVLGRPVGFENSKIKIINIGCKQTLNQEICNMLCDLSLQPKKKTKLISEGLSLYFNKTNVNKMAEARKVLPKGEFYILELWESPTQYERGLSSPMGAAFIDFLINKAGKAKMLMLLKDQTIENAEKVYPDFKNLVEVFEAMLYR